ncbi:MAG: transposase [Francisella sp.]|jgi:transposase
MDETYLKHKGKNVYSSIPNTSGFVEGFNNKIKVIKRRCYGIFDEKSLFRRVFFRY